MRKWFTRLCLCLVTLHFAGCGVAILPEEQIASQGHRTFSDMKRRKSVSKDARHIQQVRRVGRRIADVANVSLPGTQWEFVVFDGDDLNAFALPGGKVGVYVGLLKLTDSDDELAAVLGHEIAHVALRHGNKRASQGIGLALGGVLVDAAMRDKKRSKRQAAQTAYGVGATLGVALPFNRTQETEADERGLLFAALAGYDPRASVSFWKKMQAKSQIRMPEFLSTHPDPGKRIEFLEANMERAMRIYRKGRPAHAKDPL